MGIFFPETLNIVYRAGQLIDGRWVVTKSVTTIQGDAQPVNSSDIEMQDIGRRDIGKIKVYTGTPLNVATLNADNTTGNDGTMIQFSGKWYEVIMEDVRQKLIRHYKYIAEYRKDFNVG